MTYRTDDRHRISDYFISIGPEETEEYWVREGAGNILYTSEGGRIPFRQCKSGAFKGKFFCRKKDITPETEKGAIAFMLKAYFYAFLDDDLYDISNDDDFGIRLEWKYASPQARTLQLLESYEIQDKHFKRFGGWIVTKKGHLIYEPVGYFLYNDELYSDDWMKHFQMKSWFSNNVKRNFAEAYEYAKQLHPKWMCN